MSIISNVTAEANRVEMLIDFLKTTKKQYSKQDLEDIFSPSSGRKGDEPVFRAVYTVTDSLGVIEIENDSVKLNIKHSRFDTSKIIKEAIFNDEFLKKDNIAHAIAWLLIQNSIGSLGWSDNIVNTVNKDLNENFTDFGLTNNSRWQHFGYWCIYLGFATKIYVAEKSYLCPDPTKAIENELANIFKNTKELVIKDFQNSISKILPVLEQGYIREEISSSAREGLQLANNTLSFATSLALIRLESRKVIKLEHKSDANSITIQNGKNNRIISHIVYIGK